MFGFKIRRAALGRCKGAASSWDKNSNNAAKAGDFLTREEELNIIHRIIGGESELFETLVLENQTAVYNLALKMTKNEQDALDLS